MVNSHSANTDSSDSHSGDRYLAGRYLVETMAGRQSFYSVIWSTVNRLHVFCITVIRPAMIRATDIRLIEIWQRDIWSKQWLVDIAFTQSFGLKFIYQS